jgi:hypothetical protein
MYAAETPEYREPQATAGVRRVGCKHSLCIMSAISSFTDLSEYIFNGPTGEKKATSSVPDSEVERGRVRVSQWVVLVRWLLMEIVHDQ